MKRIFLLCCAMLFLMSWDHQVPIFLERTPTPDPIKLVTLATVQVETPQIEPPRATQSPQNRPERATAPKPRTQYPQKNVPPIDSPFWHHLGPGCENGQSDDSANGLYHGWFQFAQGTWNSMARKTPEMKQYLGVDPHTLSYETQKLGAWHWAHLIENPGGTAGWPVCWHKAMAHL